MERNWEEPHGWGQRHRKTRAVLEYLPSDQEPFGDGKEWRQESERSGKGVGVIYGR